MTPYERLGGEEALEAIVERFIDRVVDDVMIGYLFSGVDRERLKAQERAFAARHLGAKTAYTGKGMREAHAPHRILAGHFERRLKLLEEVLTDAGAPEDVVRHWLAVNRALRDEITQDAGCEAGGALPIAAEEPERSP